MAAATATAATAKPKPGLEGAAPPLVLPPEPVEEPPVACGDPEAPEDSALTGLEAELIASEIKEIGCLG